MILFGWVVVRGVNYESCMMIVSNYDISSVNEQIVLRKIFLPFFGVEKNKGIYFS